MMRKLLFSAGGKGRIKFRKICWQKIQKLPAPACLPTGLEPPWFRTSVCQDKKNRSQKKISIEMNGGSLWKPWRKLCLKTITNQHFSKPYLQPTKFLKVLVTGLILKFDLRYPEGQLEFRMWSPPTSFTLSALFCMVSTPAPPLLMLQSGEESQRPLQFKKKHHSSKASILRCSAFFAVQCSHPYMITGNTTALTRWTWLPYLIFFAGLSGVWERDEAGLENGDELGPLLFHS